jgi:hypothetical protein
MRSIRTAVKPVLQHAALVLVSLGISVAAVEVALAIDGRYDRLATQALVSSPAIWERQANEVAKTVHPDLRVMIEARTDSTGVRNHSALATDRKERIIGVFGDSSTENRRVDDRFTFTSLLDGTTGTRARVVNYGVDGYGLDQSYLRYKKYEAHDIRHVIYFFCANDLRNLYETGLAEVTPAGEVVLRPPREKRLRRLLGRLRVTYLALTAYHQLAGALRGSKGGDPATFRQERNAADRRARVHNAYADAMVDDFMTETPRDETMRWARMFLLVLQKWQAEVTSRGRSFTVLVLPQPAETAVAEKLLKAFNGRVTYLERGYGESDAFKFRNDGHWNEYGNLRAAEIIAGNPDLPFHQDIVNPAFLEGWKSRIDEYYREHR